MLDAILALFAALVSKDPLDLSDLASKSDFVTTMFRLLKTLDRDNDPLWLISCGMNDIELKRAGLSKSEKISVCWSCAQFLVTHQSVVVRLASHDRGKVCAI